MLKDEDKFQNYFTVGFGSSKSWQVQFVNKVREKKKPQNCDTDLSYHIHLVIYVLF
jgi:hypothetical protein